MNTAPCAVCSHSLKIRSFLALNTVPLSGLPQFIYPLTHWRPPRLHPYFGRYEYMRFFRHCFLYLQLLYSLQSWGLECQSVQMRIPVLTSGASSWDYKSLSAARAGSLDSRCGTPHLSWQSHVPFSIPPSLSRCSRASLLGDPGRYSAFAFHSPLPLLPPFVLLCKLTA